jgi:hypothetical protein
VAVVDPNKTDYLELVLIAFFFVLDRIFRQQLENQKSINHIRPIKGHGKLTRLITGAHKLKSITNENIVT